MKGKVKGWWLIRLALTIVGRKGFREMTRASKNGKEALAKNLRQTLTLSKDTVYGKEHHFGEIIKAKTPDELFELYRKNVHINDYEDLRAYVDRHKNGEPSVLIPGRPKMYSTTSGTTKEPKWIPVSDMYYKQVYRTMNQIWFYAMMKSRPHCYSLRSLSIVGKAIEGAAPDGTMSGSISGVIQRDVPIFMKETYSAPHDAFYVNDYKSRYYTLILLGLAKDISIIITANPSTLVELQNNVNENFETYCDDIEHGTINKKFDVSEEILTAVKRKHLKPNPKRAAELRKMKAKYGTILPKHYWPNLQIVTCWFSGNTKIYYDRIRDSYPAQCLFHEFGYISTECKAGVVIKSNCRETVVFGHKNYIEFIHESEIDNPAPRIYQAYEVEEGKRYILLVTTCSGLYRYNTNDLVLITGFVNDFPCIEFIQKVNGTVSLTGEKLHEQQFIEAVRETEKKTGKIAPFFVGFADPVKSRYKFYLEFADQQISITEAEEFTKYLDNCLMEYNTEYRDKRVSNRLKEPETALLGPEAYERFKEICVNQKGYREAQFKFNLLMQDEMRHALFKELVKK
ncbi:MAG: GH3 auxin-responsive promoter family protein [Treponema sp.]|nr:GH3 auxin-responsive promoter family protein [Treponema sp.]